MPLTASPPKDLITKVTAYQILDNKGRPVLEAKVKTERGATGTLASPTGSTVGKHEPLVLRDGDVRYDGLSVLKAVANVVHTIGPAIVGMNVFDQKAIDIKLRGLDATPYMSSLGGNAICSVSGAVLCAAAASKSVPLYKYIAGSGITEVPLPIFNIINGCRSGDRLDPCYEYIIVPYGAKNIHEAVQMAVEVYRALPGVWEERLGRGPVAGAAYGLEAHSAHPGDVLSLMQRAIDKCGYVGRICFAIDCAAVDVYDKETDTYPWLGERIGPAEWIERLRALTEAFDIAFIEDPLDENDFENHANARREINRTLILGDDLTVTNSARLEIARERSAVDGFIFKLNQAGTVSDAMNALEYAGTHNMRVVASGRSGGTMSDPTTEFALGNQVVSMVKAGAPTTADRVRVVNDLIRFAEESEGQVKLRDVSGFVRFAAKYLPLNG